MVELLVLRADEQTCRLVAHASLPEKSPLTCLFWPSFRTTLEDLHVITSTRTTSKGWNSKTCASIEADATLKTGELNLNHLR